MEAIFLYCFDVVFCWLLMKCLLFKLRIGIPFVASPSILPSSHQLYLYTTTIIATIIATTRMHLNDERMVIPNLDRPQTPVLAIHCHQDLSYPFGRSHLLEDSVVISMSQE